MGLYPILGLRAFHVTLKKNRKMAGMVYSTRRSSQQYGWRACNRKANDGDGRIAAEGNNELIRSFAILEDQKGTTCMQTYIYIIFICL